MTFILGVWAILFVTFIPGYVLVSLFRLVPIAPRFAMPFGLSLIFCNLLGFALVIAGLYTTPVVIAIAGVLTAAAGAIWWRTAPAVATSIKRYAVASIEASLQAFTTNWLRAVLAAIVLGGVAWAVFRTATLATERSWSIFLEWDSVVSWNRWAIDWANNRFPHLTWHYPQLIPISWSLTYLFIEDTSNQLFATSIKFLYVIAIIDAIVHYAARTSRVFLLASVPISCFLMLAGIGHTALDDMADVPVAFFSLLATTLALLRGSEQDTRRRLALMILAFLAASGAAATKQVGLYMFPAVGLIILLDDRSPRTFARLLLVGSVSVLLASPTYLWSEVLIAKGVNQSELGYVLDGIFGDKTYWQRTTWAIPRLMDTIAPHGAWILAVALAAVFRRDGAIVLFLVALPFTLIWSFLFSYDNRNLAIGFVAWGLCAGIGVSILLDAALRFTPRAFLRLGGRVALLRHRWQGLSWPGSVQHSLQGVRLASVGVLAFAVFAMLKGPTSAEMAARQEALLPLLGGNPDIAGAVNEAVAGAPVNTIWIVSEWRWTCVLPSVQGKQGCRIAEPGADTFFETDLGKKTLSDFDRKGVIVLFEPYISDQKKALLRNNGFRLSRTAEGGYRTHFYVREAH